MRRRTDEDARERAVQRGVAAVAVAVLHVALIFVLIQADWIPGLHPRSPAEAPLLWLLLPKAPGTPKVVQQRSQKEAGREAPRFYSLPITLPPAPNAIDPALALGQALACGANSFEYLTPQGRASCRRPPWNYTYARDGTIVLNTQYKPPEPKPTPAEVMQHEQQYTAPSCPEYVDPNAPCISGIIGGH
jgi:hypothetical protein